MEDHKDQPKSKIDRNLSSFVKTLGDEEINTFLAVLSALMAQVPAPKDSRKAYLKEVEKRLRSNGVDFLSKSRVFPTFGLKLLGNDRDGFPIPGFKCKKGKIYPSLFAWYWAELDRLSELKKPDKADVLRAQRVLCVLSFAKMIKLNSVNQIRKSLDSFEKRVSPTGGSLDTNEMRQGYASNFEANLFRELFAMGGEFFEDDGSEPPYDYYREDAPDLIATLGLSVNLDDLPDYLDFSSFSTKPSSVRGDKRFPEWFSCENPRFLYCKPPPYGKIHVITEAAGKLRLIAPYNTPFVHSTGLYSRCRAVLCALRQDCSDQQSIGHRFAQRRTSSGKLMCVSADLSNFSDDIDPELASFGLRSLGLEKLDSYLFNLPVRLPNGRYVIPNKLLMGLKGCFELSSVCHHYVTQLAGIKDYVMCGDDLLFTGELSTYEAALERSGWSINRSKTVVSNTVAVFCGEMYWFGYRVSPRVPKVSSCFRNGKLRDTSVLFSVVRCSIGHLNVILSRRGVASVMAPVLRLLRSKWKSVICLNLPEKLRGLGMKPSRPGTSLLGLLKKRSVLRCSLLSIGIKQDIVSGNRWFGIPIELTTGETLQEFSFTPALLKKGCVKLDVPISRSAVKKDVSSLDVYHVLPWFYENERLDPNQFKSTFNSRAQVERFRLKIIQSSM